MADLHAAIWSLPLGAALDALLGDPKGWPHPVRAIGGLITRTEPPARRLAVRLGGGPRAERGAGVALATVVIGATSLAAWMVVEACDRLDPMIALVGRSVLVYWGLAARSLGEEALRVATAPDLSSARRALSEIVGRDTDNLDGPAICRACVETVGENGNDAVIAPLFWLMLGGPVLLWAYKAVNTLDSMVGYRNARYQHLGWASARLDDLAGLAPARLTWLVIALASGLLNEDAPAALALGWRDGRKHPSPNAAWGEAALAGALHIQLGGPSTYGRLISVKPLLGDPGDPVGPTTVRRAVRVIWVAAGLAVVLAWSGRAWLLRR